MTDTQRLSRAQASLPHTTAVTATIVVVFTSGASLQRDRTRAPAAPPRSYSISTSFGSWPELWYCRRSWCTAKQLDGHTQIVEHTSR